MVADGSVRHLSLAMSVLALTCPLLLIPGVRPSPGEGSIVMPVVFLIIFAMTLLSALSTYRKDLQYYSENSMETDSKVELHVRIPRGASGRWRLLFYYPFTFASVSFGVAASIGFLWPHSA